MSTLVMQPAHVSARYLRALWRQPLYVVMQLTQPLIWLLLFGQLFKNVTRLGGFGTSSYITFLAPAIVVMNAFFSASWSGMSMVFDIERKFVERFLATPASRLPTWITSTLTALPHRRTMPPKRPRSIAGPARRIRDRSRTTNT